MKCIFSTAKICFGVPISIFFLALVGANPWYIRAFGQFMTHKSVIRPLSSLHDGVHPYPAEYHFWLQILFF
jgi:hypothetical protein